jgi:hypothetical protein
MGLLLYIYGSRRVCRRPLDSRRRVASLCAASDGGSVLPAYGEPQSYQTVNGDKFSQAIQTGLARNSMLNDKWWSREVHKDP